MIVFLVSKSMLWCNHSFEQMCLFIWTGFSGEQCGPWASCFFLRKKNLCKRTLYCHEVSKIPHHFTNQEFFFQVVKNFVIFLKKLNLEFLCKHKGWVLKIKSNKVFQTIKSSMTIWYKNQIFTLKVLMADPAIFTQKMQNPVLESRH